MDGMPQVHEARARWVEPAAETELRVRSAKSGMRVERGWASAGGLSRRSVMDGVHLVASRIKEYAMAGMAGLSHAPLNLGSSRSAVAHRTLGVCAGTDVLRGVLHAGILRTRSVFTQESG